MSPADTNIDLTTLKYLEPAAAGSGEEPKLVTSEYTSVRVLFSHSLNLV